MRPGSPRRGWKDGRKPRWSRASAIARSPAACRSRARWSSIDTLHPIHEGRAFRWEREKPEATLTEYGRTAEGEAAERWRTSPLYRLLTSGDSLLRLRVTAETEAEFPSFGEFREAKFTDYVAIINRFAEDGVIGEMDCVYSFWMTDRAEGFADDEIGALKRLTPFLGLAIKSASLARIAETLVETYLGRDAGRRVLKGRIERGVADRIKTVLWFSDLRNYTRISETSPPEQIIPLLNDYADAIVSSIHEHSGDVLKLIGDGVLAIFPAEDRAAPAPPRSTPRERRARPSQRSNARRFEKGLPTTEMYLGLHLGEVFYGNIGSKERLDFTVVGPAVNEVSRIAAMCRSVDQPILVSSAFAASAAEQRRAFASVGRFALRGVGKPQELFTLDLRAACRLRSMRRRRPQKCSNGNKRQGRAFLRDNPGGRTCQQVNAFLSLAAIVSSGGIGLAAAAAAPADSRRPLSKQADASEAAYRIRWANIPSRRSAGSQQPWPGLAGRMDPRRITARRATAGRAGSPAEGADDRRGFRHGPRRRYRIRARGRGRGDQPSAGGGGGRPRSHRAHQGGLAAPALDCGGYSRRGFLQASRRGDGRGLGGLDILVSNAGRQQTGRRSSMFRPRISTRR